MPEGPSIVILKEAVQEFKGRTICVVSGNSKAFDLSVLINQTILDFKSWGKHFLICFEKCTVRIHFMLFGSYRINEEKAATPRLSLKFEDGQLNFYTCSVQLLEQPLDEVYDWSADVMNPNFDAGKAIAKLKSRPELLVCDALLDQNIFAGVGNIIKNEVLFRIHLHPLNQIKNLPDNVLKDLTNEAVNYSFDFLKWKKEFTLKKHWLAHKKTVCPRDGFPLIKEYLGKTNRRTFYCSVCQLLYSLS
ncbi:DNA-formamidopyrimidine glycosylase family protein [Rubrolithibacter danxiaensis]|uniref:DNA-formamidopyrimidine glycosylase family protein n=1 Tax=Rubrolithibacter danxiaensis TaxID=3390805 RepID=UPI003BF80E7E